MVMICFGQVSSAQIEHSTDIKQIAEYIKQNLNDPKVPALKRKIAQLMNEGTSESNTSKEQKATSSKDKSKKVEMLNHLFNNDPKRKDAALMIYNKSNCPLLLKIAGKKNFSLQVPAMGENYILLKKGRYKLSTSVCGANYIEVKNIQKDMQITLNN